MGGYRDEFYVKAQRPVPRIFRVFEFQNGLKPEERENKIMKGHGALLHNIAPVGSKTRSEFEYGRGGVFALWASCF